MVVVNMTETSKKYIWRSTTPKKKLINQDFTHLTLDWRVWPWHLPRLQQHCEVQSVWQAVKSSHLNSLLLYVLYNYPLSSLCFLFFLLPNNSYKNLTGRKHKTKVHFTSTKGLTLTNEHSFKSRHNKTKM